MKKFLKLVGIPFLIAVLIFLFIRFVWLKEFTIKDITIDEYVTMYNSKQKIIVFVTNDGFVDNDSYEEVIINSFHDKKIKVYKLDLTDSLAEEKFISANGFSSDEYVIPMLLYVNDGALVASIDGYSVEFSAEYETRIQNLISTNNIE